MHEKRKDFHVQIYFLKRLHFSLSPSGNCCRVDFLVSYVRGKSR